MNILSLDPSLNSVGVALSIGGRIPRTATLNPRGCHEWKDRGRKMMQITENLIRQVDDFLGEDTFNIGIIEYPNFQVSTRGLIAGQKGYTIDLGFICGVILSRYPTQRWYLPTPIEWKGTQPKEAMGKKFTRWTGIDYRSITDHEYEAAMMIKWYLEK